MFLQATTSIELEEELRRRHAVPQLKCQLWELILLDNAEDVCPAGFIGQPQVDVSRVGWDVDVLGNSTRRTWRLHSK